MILEVSIEWHIQHLDVRCGGWRAEFRGLQSIDLRAHWDHESRRVSHRRDSVLDCGSLLPLSHKPSNHRLDVDPHHRTEPCAQSARGQAHSKTWRNLGPSMESFDLQNVGTHWNSKTHLIAGCQGSGPLDDPFPEILSGSIFDLYELLHRFPVGIEKLDVTPAKFAW